MRLFFGSLGNMKISLNSIIVDGGESIFLTPDASGGEFGRGFTCTGLFFDSWQPNGNPRFWVGNDGRDREPGAGGIDPQDFQPSIVLLELDYSANDNTVPATVYATKIRELLTETIRDGTVQGVAKANDGTIWYASSGVIININSSPGGIATELSRFSVSGANGLAYDPTDNTLLIHDGTGAVKRYSTSGTLIDNSVVSISTAADQIFLDLYDTDILYYSSGSNGSPMNVTKVSISGAVSNVSMGITNALAAEGVAVAKSPNDGVLYVYGASDAWYHQTGIAPDYAINAIHKVTQKFITDGGELIALVPNVPDGEPGRGYTNTGLHYCKEESEARSDGKIIFWSSNWGRKDSGTAGGRFQGIAKIAIDYEANNGMNVPPAYTAELLDHMETHSLYTTSSMQGIMQRGNGGTVYISDSGLRGYQPQSDINGTAVPVGSILQGGPALAYDPTDDTYLRGQGEVVERWSFSPNVLVETLAIDLTGFTIDHISLNVDEDIFMVTGSGRTLRYYRYSTLELIGSQSYVPPATNIDIEGCALVKSHYDGKYYVYISSDNWFHSDGNPDTDVNAIWKLEPSITLPLT